MSDEFANLVELWEKSCQKHAQRDLFGTKTGSGWRWTSFGEFKELVDQCRAGLALLGVEPGDRVAIVADNRVEWAVGAYATYGRGAAYVPMYQVQQPKEWKFILEDCDAKVVFAATNEIYEKLVEIANDLPKLEHVIGLDLPEKDDSSYRALLAKGKKEPVDPVYPEPGDIAGLIYTSGTTGNPKGVLLSHDNFCSNVNALHGIFFTELTEEDRSLSFLPWAHSFGQTCELHALLSNGSSLAINDEIPNLVGNLAEVKPSVLFAVPRIFNRIYDGVNAQMAAKSPIIQKLFRSGIAHATKKNAGDELGLGESISLWIADKLIFSKIREKFGGRLKYAISGSAALDKAVAQFIDALGIMVYEGYGLTETSPIVSANFPGARKIGSIGKPIPGVTVEIDESKSDTPGEGEIVVRGPNVMQGYHNRPDENAAVLGEDRSFRTGDLGRIDSDGFLYITGRIKEQYKLENGKYVMPAPLEEQLKLSPFIANALIFGDGKPHNVALVVTDPGAVKSWAEKEGVDVGDVETNEKLRKVVEKELKDRGADFKGFEKPRDFAIIKEDFTTDNGLLTPTMKLKRKKIVEQYQDKLDKLYTDSGKSKKDGAAA